MNIKFGVEQTITQRFEWIYEVADGLTADEIQKETEVYLKRWRGALAAGDVPYALVKLGRVNDVNVTLLDMLEDVENISLDFDTFEVTESCSFDEEYPEDSDDFDEDWG